MLSPKQRKLVRFFFFLFVIFASIFTVSLCILLPATTYAHAQQLSREVRPVEHTEQAALVPTTKMIATPNTGGSGSYFYLSGKGFKAKELLGVYWGKVTKAHYLGKVVADKQGTFSYAGFYTPLGLVPGNYSILILRSTGKKAAMLSVPFHILAPKMQVRWLSGTAHTLLLHMVNFAADEKMLITWNAASGQMLGSTISHYNGEAYFSVVPSSVAEGTYTITVRGQTSKLSVSEQLAFR